MCRFAVDLIDFEELSEAKKKALLKDLQKRRDALEAQLDGLNQALKVAQKKSKGRS
jgi:hypothetical protein